MDKLPSFGTSIKESMVPTMTAYAPLLEANASAIRSTPSKTFSYGPHPRHELDVYYPPSRTSSSPAMTPPPVLIFFHGGGLTIGGKTLASALPLDDSQPPWASGLVYANLGHFFASQYGMVTVVANYRLDRHGAIFPSGGEDWSLAIGWVRENLATGALGESAAVGPRDLYLMGNSAGGMHLMTYLLQDDFVGQRRDLMASGAPLALRATVALSVPMDLEFILPHWVESWNRYYKNDVKGNLPQGLINSTLEKGSEVAPGVRILIADFEFDAPEEVIKPSAAAASVLNKHRPADLLHLPGHNHHSPVYALGTSIEREEAWGHTVARWLMM